MTATRIKNKALLLSAIIIGIKNKSVGIGNIIDSKKEIIEITFQDFLLEESLIVLSYIDWILFFNILLLTYSINGLMIYTYNFSKQKTVLYSILNLLNKKLYKIFIFNQSPYGGIGRRDGFKIR